MVYFISIRLMFKSKAHRLRTSVPWGWRIKRSVPVSEQPQLSAHCFPAAMNEIKTPKSAKLEQKSLQRSSCHPPATLSGYCPSDLMCKFVQQTKGKRLHGEWMGECPGFCMFKPGATPSSGSLRDSSAVVSSMLSCPENVPNSAAYGRNRTRWRMPRPGTLLFFSS